MSRLTVATTSQPATADCALLRTIVDSLIDGVLLLTPLGEWVYGNHNAHRLCQSLSLGQPTPEKVPSQIRQICHLFLSDPNQSNYPAAVESEITTESGDRYRVRVSWLQTEEAKTPYLLVTLEDCYQAARSRAIAESLQYKLTERQAEVWLLHRTGHTYRETAAKLFVSHNTVKRHMKDIYAKQRQE